ARSAGGSRCRTRARHARSARSPSGSTGSYGRLLASGGPQLCLFGALLLLGRPQLVARAGELERDALDVGDDPVERLAHPQVVPQKLGPAAREDLVDDLLRLLALAIGVLANELSDFVVGHVDARLVRDRLERQLARDRQRRLRLQALLELLRRLVREREVGLGRDPASLERAHQAGEELRGPGLDERSRRLDVRGDDERVRRGGPELRLDLLLDLLAQRRLDVGAQLGKRIELARGARQLVVDRRQDLLLQLLERDLDSGLLSVRELVLDALRLARRHADEGLLELFDHAAEPQFDDVVALGVAVGGDEVDDQRVARLGRPALDRYELRDREPVRLELLVDELRRNLDLGGRHLELRPVRDLDLRLHVDRRGEAEVLVGALRELVVVLRPRDR